MNRPLTRRAFLASTRQLSLGALALTVPPGWLVACSPAGAPAAQASGAAGVSPSAPASATAGASPQAWAAGGVAAMKGGYADPFVAGAGTPCVLAPAMTLGPCHVAAPERRDISEGVTGLPMRLSLRVVRAGGCEPVEGATVEVWHTSASGVYSAFPAASFCNPGAQDLRAKAFCRGSQKTDANGRVDFDTVFPGWYPGRTVHVHFTVHVGQRAAVTSQLFFDDGFTDQILAAHPDYATRPRRDTTNATDGIARSDLAAVLLQTARLPDGALHAWKTIALR